MGPVQDALPPDAAPDLDAGPDAQPVDAAVGLDGQPADAEADACVGPPRICGRPAQDAGDGEDACVGPPRICGPQDDAEAPDAGPAADGGAAPGACPEGLGADGLTFTIPVADPLAHLHTDAARQDTAEVYCLAPEGEPRGAVVMVPGLGLSHYLYLTTPDRRPGWATRFAEAGYMVFVINPAGNVTSTVDPDPPEGVRSWAPATIWRRWGFGAAEGQPYDDTRFPTAQIDDFLTYMPLHQGGATTREQLLEVLGRSGPAVVITHSAGGPSGFAAALAEPDAVRAMVVVEPTGCPDDAAGAPPTPFLAVYGDYIDSRNQGNRLASCRATAANVAAAGHRSAVFSYPDEAVFGNTHVLMQDDNSGAIAQDVLEWLDGP